MPHALRLLLLLGALLGLGCGAATSQPAASATGAFKPVQRRPSKPAVLVLMPDTPQAAQVWTGLQSELASDFDVITSRIEKESTLEELTAAIDRTHPACLVLLNNPTLRLYKRYQQSRPRGTRFLPAIAVMTSFLEESARDVQNLTGIAYEVPGVIQFVKLRSIVARPVRRVGVVYRQPFRAYVTRERQLASIEQVEVVGKEVPRDPDQGAVQTALTELLDHDRVDALWVLNDNALLSPELISSVWLPSVNGSTHVPVIVGVPTLLGKNYPVGSLAMVPDHVALGVQTANMVFDLADKQWQLGDHAIKLPISIKTLVEVHQVRDYFGLQPGGLDNIDESVE